MLAIAQALRRSEDMHIHIPRRLVCRSSGSVHVVVHAVASASAVAAANDDGDDNEDACIKALAC
jgi:hypothetical protein